jgi:tetratricopeptide (TPR) repeat protein
VTSYFAIVFSDLERHSLVWSRVPRDRMVAVIAEYRYLAQSIASQYGRRHENFAGDGHLFLFESADAAVHFALKLIAFWKERRQFLSLANGDPEMPLRLGCHFGECTELAGGDDWIGRAINLAKRVEGAATPDTLFVTQTIIELIDLPLYEFEEAGMHTLAGDYLPRRQLYRLLSVDWAALAQRPAEELTAEDWFLRGVALVGSARENSEEEAECYRQALRLRADYPKAHNNLAILLKAQGDQAAAVEHYQAALQLWPQYAEAHYNYAIVLEDANNIADAAEHYRAAIRWRPDYIDACHRYANLLAAQGEVTDADKYYREALRLRPAYAEAHNNYAIMLERIGDHGAAEAHYREALRLRPDYREAHYNYAMFLESRGEPNRAEEQYRAALQLSPDFAEAHNNLAVLLHGRGDLAGAEAHYATALHLRPQDPETNYNFALVAQAKGDQATADRHFRMARELAPEDDKFPSAIVRPA